MCNNQEGDPARCLGESISFGRYMSEPLEWEKWSAFSSNRYLEEVERYSKPESVAKMKTYFKTCYNTIASKNRAANQAEELTREISSKGVVQHSSCEEATQGNDLETSSTSFTAPTAPPQNQISVQIEGQCLDDLESSAHLEAESSHDFEVFVLATDSKKKNSFGV